MKDMEIHTSTQTEIREIPPAVPSWRDSAAFKTAEALRPWIQWAMIIILTIGSLYMYNRDTNAEQSTSLKDLETKTAVLEKTIAEKGSARDRQIDDLRKSTVTTELFKERTDNIQQQLSEIKSDQKEMLNLLRTRP